MWNAVRGWFKSALDGEGATASKPQVTLAKALARDWLEVWYQPKVDLQSNNQVVGAEALIRVRHPQLGVLGPGAFLPGASTADNVPVSAFAELPIAKIVRRHRPSDDRWPGLILEVTEDQAISDLEMANEVAQDLQAQNCSLAIDDFGAGYSSLARLRQLPFSELNIDLAYVTDCHADRTRAGVLESVIDLARRFGLKSVAEGIESARESHKLQGLGCNLGQGFYFAKPMAKSDFIASLPRRVVPRKTVERGWWRSGRALKPSG
jgi:EAL domain-containing protein (putative c-di-GMP-specific phosphodiesterase class I)